MGFRDDLSSFGVRMERKSKDVFVATTVEVRRSVVEGSEITNAPGQPIDTGALRASFIDDFEGSGRWRITTNQSYARHIEDNGGDVGDSSGDVIRGGSAPNPKGPSTVGGHHSVKKTRAAWQRIVNHVNGGIR